jgi:hypothetical protein
MSTLKVKVSIAATQKLRWTDAVWGTRRFGWYGIFS